MASPAPITIARKARSNGYSLVETAMVLGVLGFVTGLFLTIGAVHREQRNADGMEQSFSLIDEALQRYVNDNGYLPCPADPAAAEGGASYGVSVDCFAAPTGAVTDTGAGVDTVRTGVVPTRTLKLRDADMLDPWGNRITYAVIRDLAKDINSFDTYATARTDGVIAVGDGAGHVISDGQADTVNAYILISHGQDKRGAYNRRGMLSAACGAATKDAENCNGDAAFVDTEIANSDIPANYFYDIVHWKTKGWMKQTPPPPPPPSTIVAQIDAGNAHTCAVMADNTAWCWGRNLYGQLGDGTGGVGMDKHVPTQVSGLTGVIQIAAGYTHSCALKTDGTVWCWGDNAYGQLGNNTTTESHVPVQVSGLTGVSRITAGGTYGAGPERRGYSCAAKADGTAWCWGDNSQGQLGDNTAVEKHVPVQVSGIVGVGQIAAAGIHTCASSTDTSVTWCWGNNAVGKLGEGGMIPFSYTPVPAAIVGTIQLSAWGVGAGSGHSCAVKSDGTAWCWGSNGSYELGDGTTFPRYFPTAVSGLAGASQATTGNGFSCALKADGTAWCWGDNSNGHIGDGTTITRPAPTQVSGLSSVSQASSGDYHSCAIKSDGTAWCWGYNFYGYLGDGTTTTRLTPVQVVFP